MSPGERAALFIAPPLAPIVLVTIIAFPNYMGDFFQSIQIVALFGIPIAYVIALCLGLPLYFLAKDRRSVNFWSLSLGGAVVADLPALLTLLYLYDTWETGGDWRLHATFGITGFVDGVVFWCVLRYWPHITLRSSGTAQKRAAPELHVMPIKESDFMILVTGFGPYRESTNASGVLVKSLKDELTTELFPFRVKLAFEVITCDDTSRDTEHLSLESQLSELLKRHKPSLCIHTGQAPPYNKITIEKIATNSFMREVIDPKRPVAYWSNLPGTEDLMPVLEDQGIPACYSFYCGQHLCNHILYSSLYYSEQNGHPHKSGFIHIPLLPEQVTKEHRDSPYMPLEMSRKALSLIIDHVAKVYGHNTSLNLTRGADAPLAG